MGCIQTSEIPGTEVNLAKNTGRYSAIFAAKDFVVTKEDFKIDERALCDDNYEGVLLVRTEKNDIRRISKIEIVETATIVSRNAVTKLLERKHNEKRSTKIFVDKEKLANRLSRQINKVSE